MSPLEVSMLMHFHARPEPYPSESSPSQSEIIGQFLDEDIIELVEDAGYQKRFYQTTEKGSAWVDMICNTPIPVQMWVDPRET